MPEINTKFLFTIALEIQVSNLGDTPYGRRRIFHFDVELFPLNTGRSASLFAAMHTSC